MKLSFFSDDPITIGVPNIDNANGLKGIIDEVRISNIARTEDEINKAMKFGLQSLTSVTTKESILSTWAMLKKKHQ